MHWSNQSNAEQKICNHLTVVFFLKTLESMVIYSASTLLILFSAIVTRTLGKLAWAQGKLENKAGQACSVLLAYIAVLKYVLLEMHSEVHFKKRNCIYLDYVQEDVGKLS